MNEECKIVIERLERLKLLRIMLETYPIVFAFAMIGFITVIFALYKKFIL